MIVKIREIAQFTRATPGSSLVSHNLQNFVPCKTCQSLSLYFVTNFVRKTECKQRPKIKLKSQN